MKPLSLLPGLLSIGLSLLATAGCTRHQDESKLQHAFEAGRSISGAFMTNLKDRLVTAIEDGGPAEAIGVCQVDAPAITAEAAAADPAVLDLRRVSLRWRNPVNQPDALDRGAWSEFAQRESPAPEQPEELLVEDYVEGERIVYYRALRMAPLCLTCHGPAGQIPPEVTTLLAQRYPDDRATGFTIGELRGLIRIDFDPEKIGRPGAGS